MAVWLSGRASGSLLYRLGALSQIGDASTALLAKAEVEQHQAKALGDQAAAQGDDPRRPGEAGGGGREHGEGGAAGRGPAGRADRCPSQDAAGAAREPAGEVVLPPGLVRRRATGEGGAAAAAGATSGGTGLGGIAGGPDSLRRPLPSRTPRRASAPTAGAAGRCRV